MTLIAPVAMKNSLKIKLLMSAVIPIPIKYGAKLVSVTMKPFLLPEESGVNVERSYRFIIHFSLYLVNVISIIIVSIYVDNKIYFLLPLSILGLLLIYKLRKLFTEKIRKLEEQVNYRDIHQGPYNLDTIIRFISNLFSALLTIILLGSSFWNYGYKVMIILLVSFTAYLVFVSIYVYRVSRAKSQLG